MTNPTQVKQASGIYAQPSPVGTRLPWASADSKLKHHERTGQLVLDLDNADTCQVYAEYALQAGYLD